MCARPPFQPTVLWLSAGGADTGYVLRGVMVDIRSKSDIRADHGRSATSASVLRVWSVWPAFAADLRTPRWDLTVRGVQIEAKPKIHRRLGRSPDKGEAVVLALGGEGPVMHFVDIGGLRESRLTNMWKRR